MENLSLMSVINEDWGSSYHIDEIPSYVFVSAPQRSTSIIQQGFRDAKYQKYPEMKPITNVAELKQMVKASRKKETVDNIEHIWGLQVGKLYTLVCLDYESTGSFKPKRIVLFLKKGLKKIADSTSAKGIVEQVTEYLRNKEMKVPKSNRVQAATYSHA